MNHFLKLAFDAGAQQAMIDSGLVKQANLSELYDAAVEATSRGIGNVADSYDAAVNNVYRGIKALDNEFNFISNMPSVRPAKAVDNPGTPALRKARDDNMRYHSDRIYAQDMAADKKAIEGFARASLEPGEYVHIIRDKEREALAERGRRLDAALARNNRRGNPARTPGAPENYDLDRFPARARLYFYDGPQPSSFEPIKSGKRDWSRWDEDGNRLW